MPDRIAEVTWRGLRGGSIVAVLVRAVGALGVRGDERIRRFGDERRGGACWLVVQAGNLRRDTQHGRLLLEALLARIRRAMQRDGFGRGLRSLGGARIEHP